MKGRHTYVCRSLRAAAPAPDTLALGRGSSNPYPFRPHGAPDVYEGRHREVTAKRPSVMEQCRRNRLQERS